MNIKNKIDDLKLQLKLLETEVLEELKLCKEQQEIYKTGDWVIHNSYGTVKIEGMHGDDYYDKKSFLNAREGFTFFNDEYQKYNIDYTWTHLKHISRKATIDEIESYLIKEAKKRGFYDRSKYIKNTLEQSVGSGITRPLIPYWSKDEPLLYKYLSDSDSLYCESGLTTKGLDVCSNPKIYKNGKWAEVIDKPKPEPIIVNGYNAEFYDNYVQFGCAKICNSTFVEYNTFANKSLISGESNRFVKGVQIGEVFFSNEVIEKIANRIKNQ